MRAWYGVLVKHTRVCEIHTKSDIPENNSFHNSYFDENGRPFVLGIVKHRSVKVDDDMVHSILYRVMCLHFLLESKKMHPPLLIRLRLLISPFFLCELILRAFKIAFECAKYELFGRALPGSQ